MFRLPPATGWLIALNVLVHVGRWLLPEWQSDIIEQSLAVHTYSLFYDFGPIDLVRLFTYQFLHGSWDHLGANMVFLLALGPGVERPVGKVPYLIIYFSLRASPGRCVEAAFADPEPATI